jgi:hypothetical protein
MMPNWLPIADIVGTTADIENIRNNVLATLAESSFGNNKKNAACTPTLRTVNKLVTNASLGNLKRVFIPG